MLDGLSPRLIESRNPISDILLGRRRQCSGIGFRCLGIPLTRTASSGWALRRRATRNLEPDVSALITNPRFSCSLTHECSVLKRPSVVYSLLSNSGFISGLGRSALASGVIRTDLMTFTSSSARSRHSAGLRFFSQKIIAVESGGTCSINGTCVTSPVFASQKILTESCEYPVARS